MSRLTNWSDLPSAECEHHNSKKKSICYKVEVLCARSAIQLGSSWDNNTKSQKTDSYTRFQRYAHHRHLATISSHAVQTAERPINRETGICSDCYRQKWHKRQLLTLNDWKKIVVYFPDFREVNRLSIVTTYWAATAFNVRKILILLALLWRQVNSSSMTKSRVRKLSPLSSHFWRRPGYIACREMARKMSPCK